MVFIVLFYTASFIFYMVFAIPKPGEDEFRAIQAVTETTELARPFRITQGAVNVGSDIYIFCLPIPAIWKLQLTPQKRFGLLATFMTGFL
ncbi:MAG: hypothetical protein M1835_002828, partial [Candelina submexicana]